MIINQDICRLKKSLRSLFMKKDVQNQPNQKYKGFWRYMKKYIAPYSKKLLLSAKTPNPHFASRKTISTQWKKRKRFTPFYLPYLLPFNNYPIKRAINIYSCIRNINHRLLHLPINHARHSEQNNSHNQTYTFFPPTLKNFHKPLPIHQIFNV